MFVILCERTERYIDWRYGHDDHIQENELEPEVWKKAFNTLGEAKVYIENNFEGALISYEDWWKENEGVIIVQTGSRDHDDGGESGETWEDEYRFTIAEVELA